jgi:hypothetical protein
MQKRQLTQWKKENDYLKSVHSQVTQDVVKRLHNTFSRFQSVNRPARPAVMAYCRGFHT